MFPTSGPITYVTPGPRHSLRPRATDTPLHLAMCTPGAFVHVVMMLELVWHRTQLCSMTNPYELPSRVQDGDQVSMLKRPHLQALQMEVGCCTEVKALRKLFSLRLLDPAGPYALRQQYYRSEAMCCCVCADPAA